MKGYNLDRLYIITKFTFYLGKIKTPSWTICMCPFLNFKSKKGDFHNSIHESISWSFKLHPLAKFLPHWSKFNLLLEDAIWIIMKLIHVLNCEHLLFWIWNLKNDTYKLFMKVFWFSLNKMWILWWYIF